MLRLTFGNSYILEEIWCNSRCGTWGLDSGVKSNASMGEGQ